MLGIGDIFIFTCKYINFNRAFIYCESQVLYDEFEHTNIKLEVIQMHLTIAVMKDGKTISGYLIKMRLTAKEGYLLMDTNGGEVKILLKDAKSIITENERISITQRCADDDILQRCRELGWDGN